jgi:hypothetical protein
MRPRRAANRLPFQCCGLRKSRSYTSCHPVCKNWRAMGNLYLFYLIHNIKNCLVHTKAFGLQSFNLYTSNSPASLLDGSVLRRLASHLLLIRTNLGYGTVLTADCGRPGCSATNCCYYCLYSLHRVYLPVLCTGNLTLFCLNIHVKLYIYEHTRIYKDFCYSESVSTTFIRNSLRDLEIPHGHAGM